MHPAEFPSSFGFEVVDQGTTSSVEGLGGNGWRTPGKRARTMYASVSGEVTWPKPPGKSANAERFENDRPGLLPKGLPLVAAGPRR